MRTTRPRREPQTRRPRETESRGFVVLVGLISVARVRPRTSKGITDLLLPQTSVGYAHNSPSKKRKNAQPWTTRLGRGPSRRPTLAPP
jgi:hypothetical protein